MRGIIARTCIHSKCSPTSHTDEGRAISNTLVSVVEHFEQTLKQGFSEGEMERFLGNSNNSL